MAVEVLTHTPMPLMYDGTSYRQNPNNEMDTYFAESNEPISTSMSTIEKVEEVDGICYTINALISKQQCGALQKYVGNLNSIIVYYLLTCCCCCCCCFVIKKFKKNNSGGLTKSDSKKQK